LNRVI